MPLGHCAFFFFFFFFNTYTYTNKLRRIVSLAGAPQPRGYFNRPLFSAKSFTPDTLVGAQHSKPAARCDYWIARANPPGPPAPPATQALHSLQLSHLPPLPATSLSPPYPPSFWSLHSERVALSPGRSQRASRIEMAQATQIRSPRARREPCPFGIADRALGPVRRRRLP